MSPHPVPRSRQAAQEKAEMLVPQVILGWGADHPLAKEVALLAGKLKASNLAYDPVGRCPGCANAKVYPGVVCRDHGTEGEQGNP